MLYVEKRCVELADTGEVLTSNDVLEQLQKADAERASKKAKKTSGITKKSSKTKKSESDSIDTTRCGKCGQVYTDDKAEDWIGCDRCESWCINGVHQMLDHLNIELQPTGPVFFTK